MRITDHAKGPRAARLARYTQIERRRGPGPLAVLRRRPREGGPSSRLSRFLGILRRQGG